MPPRTSTIGLPPILKNAYFTKIAIAAREFDRQFNINNMAIYEAGSNYLKQALMAGEIDIALLGALNMPQDDELLIIPFIRANFCVYISKNNPLSKKSHLYFSDLQKQAFVALDSSFVHNQAIKKMSQQAGFRPKYFMKTNDIHFLMNLISENLGIAILTDIVKTTASDIVVLPLLDEPEASSVLAYPGPSIPSTLVTGPLPASCPSLLGSRCGPVLSCQVREM